MPQFPHVKPGSCCPVEVRGQYGSSSQARSGVSGLCFGFVESVPGQGGPDTAGTVLESKYDGGFPGAC